MNMEKCYGIPKPTNSNNSGLASTAIHAMPVVTVSLRLSKVE